MRATFVLAALACTRAAAPVVTPPPPPPRAAYSPDELAGAVDYSELALSSDGAELAVASDRSGDVEVWTAAVKDGVAGALVQRTRLGQQVSGLAYSPDGALLFGCDRGGDEREDLWRLRRGAAAPERLTTSAFSQQEARFSPDGARLAYVADRARASHFDLEVMDLATMKATVLTHESLNVERPRWSADGRRVAVRRSPDDGQHGDVLVVDVASGKARAIAPPRKDGVLTPEAFLPDGRLVATATNAAGFLQLALVDVAAGAVTLIGPAEWDVEAARVVAGGAVLFSRNVRGLSELATLSPPLGSARPEKTLALGGVLDDLAVDGAGRVAFALRESTSRPASVVAVNLARAEVTTAVPALLPGVDLDSLAKAERVELASYDGTKLDAWLWMPPVARLGSPPPVVAWAHGGPSGQARGAFLPDVHALTEAGLAVVSVNYRGSTGYGRAFEDLNNRDWGGGDLKDILATLTFLTARGRLDPHRWGIIGGSYGGYLVLRAITSMPQTFRAAVDLYGMSDLVQDYQLTFGRYGSWYATEMGTPYTEPALFHDRSPVNALGRVTTPLLVLQGENDADVPRAESDVVVAALRALGRPVEYVTYPDEGHVFARRANRVDSWRRSAEFLARHLAR